MATYSTDFSEYTAGVEPSDWTERWDTTGVDWTVENSSDDGVTGGKILLVSRTQSNGSFLSWDAIDSDADRDDVEILAKFKHATFVNRDLGCVGRGSGTGGSEVGYIGRSFAFGGSTETIRIQEFTAGSIAALGSVTPTVAPKNDGWFWIRFRLNGTTQKLRFWRDGALEPTDWQVETADATNTAAALVGLFSLGGDSDGTTIDFVGIGTNGDAAPGHSNPSTSVVFMGQSMCAQLFEGVDTADDRGMQAVIDDLLAHNGTAISAANASVSGVSMSTKSTWEGPNGGWWDTDTDSASALLVSTVAAAITELAGSTPVAIICAAGAADANALDISPGTTKAEDKDSYVKVVDYDRTEFGIADLPILVAGLGRWADFTNTGAGQQIRQAHDELVSENATFQWAADFYDLSQVDGQHMDDAGVVALGERWAASVADFVLGVSGVVGRGPMATSAAIESTTEIDISISYPSGGTDFTAGADQFYVTEAGVAQTISSVARLSASMVRITLGAEIDLAEEILVFPVYDRLQTLGEGTKEFILANDDNAMSLQSVPSVLVARAKASGGASLHSGVSKASGVSSGQGVS